VPIDGEEDGAQHDTVILVEAVADGDGKFVGCPSWVLVSPVRNNGPCPHQLRRAILSEPHIAASLTIAY
jgi:hypothetical protein